MRDDEKSKEELLSELKSLRTELARYRESNAASEAEREALKQTVAGFRNWETEWRGLMEASRAVLQFHGFEESARRIFDLCRNTTGALSGYVALLTADGKENELLFLESGGMPCSVDPELPMPIRGLRAKAYSMAKAVYENDFMNARWAKLMPPGHVKLQNVMFAPLVLNGKAVGIIGLANKPTGFTEDDARIATAFGDIASIALQRAHSEEVLRQSEEKYRRLFEDSVLGIFRATSDGRIIEANPAFARICGFNSPAEAKSQVNDVAVDLYVDPKRGNEIIRMLLDSNRPVHTETLFRRKDGSTFMGNLHIWMVPAEGVNGKQFHMEGFVEDITERKQTEEALKDSEERLRSLINSTPDIVCFKDGEGRWLEANKADLELFQLNEIDYRGKKDSELAEYSSFYRDAFLTGEDTDEKTWHKGALTRGDEIIPVPGGTDRVFDVIKVPLFHPDGSRSGLVVLGRDVTERKLAEEALRESQQQLANIIDFLPDATFVIDREGRVIAWNRAIEEMTGIKAADILGKGNYEYALPFYGERRPILIDLALQSHREIEKQYAAFERTATVIAGETYMPALKGGKVFLFGTASALFDSKGNIIGAIESVRDITERKLMEEALRQSDWEKATLNHIANIFLTVPDENVYEEVLDVILAALQGRFGVFGYVGDKGELIFPSMTKDIWSSCQVEGNSIVFPPHSWGNSLWGKAINEGKAFYSEGPFQTPRGHLSIFNFLTIPIVFGEKAIGLVSVANKDGGFTGEDGALLERIAANISPILNARLQRDRQELDRKNAEKALRASEERLADIIDFLPDATFAINGEGIVISWNRAMEEMTGVPKEAMLGKGNLEYALPFYGVRRLLLVDLISASEEEIKREYQTVSKIGNSVVAEVFAPGTYGGKGAELWSIATALYDRSGNVSIAIQSIRDITERKQAEKSLKLSEEKYRRLFEDAVLGIFRSTVDGKIIDINPAFARMFGFNSTEEMKSQVRDVTTDLCADPSRRNELVRMLEEAKEPIQLENLYKRKDGSTFIGNLHAWAVGDVDEKHSLIEGFVEDVSERKRAEEEKATLEAQLRQAQKLEAIGTLAGGIAHDFNNILAPIIGYAEMTIIDLPDFNPVRFAQEQILSAALRAKDLIRQILVFGKPGRGQQRKPVQVSSIVKEALKLLRASLPSSIKISRHVEDVMANADPTQIHQVLMNLCTNAAHAMNNRGTLEVRLSRVNLSESDLADRSIVDLKPGPYLKLSVSDTGCGMDKATLERIFDPYFTTKDVGKGTGLGLAVAHGIVKHHGGAVTVHSDLGKGSTFSIYIPALEYGVETTDEIRPALPTGTERILLVDDEQSLVEMGAAILERLGYKVTPETNSLLALEIFRSRSQAFDLVITDHTMPNLTGTDLVKEIRRIRPDVPIILCTGFSEEVTKETAAGLCIELLMKPFGIKQLAELIRKVLGV
jgi:PAS domain S-box-containing protein